MSVSLSVRAVREAIYREAGFSSGEGSPVTGALGSLFHSAAAGLLGADCRELLKTAEATQESWIEALRVHLYRSSIAPWIAANRAGLESSTSELMVLWEAIGNFSKWAGGILWRTRFARDMVACEETLSHEFREPGWSDSVLVTGIADAVWRIPGGGWCVVEYKLGRTSPEADLAQACLYHQMLSGSGNLSEPQHAHFLVAGTTGSGKSEWLRTAIAGLLLSNTPRTLQLLPIDPKRNAFNELRGSPFLFGGEVVYPDEQPAAAIFERLVEEMEERYRIFHDAGVDSLREYNGKSAASKPRIVCICDEYADLIKGSARKDREALERQFTRLGSKARAAGIHLIIATQEARRETIRGSLDANLPARVGLRMGKDIESRLLLGRNGAENLRGNGDLLFKDIGEPIRLQAPLLLKAEREILFEGK